MDEIPLFAMLKGRLGYLNQRQKVIAQNVANADVAGFTPRDLKAQEFSSVLAGSSGLARPGGVRMQVSEPGHIAAPAGPGIGARSSGATSGDFKSIEAPDSETRMNGNSVVLEEEMLKMAESRMAYDAAISFYQQSLNMLRLAARKPGG